MGICQCTSWWDKIYRLFVPNRTMEKTIPLDITADIWSELPSDIVADIVSRLPADIVHILLPTQNARSLGSLAKTPYFVKMHFGRAAPVIAFQYFSLLASKENQVICTEKICFSDEERQNFVEKTIRVDLRFTSPDLGSMPLLYGSCNGYLLFRNLNHAPVLHVYNPVTEEETSLIHHDPRYNPCGLFFDPTAEEYKAIFVSAGEGGFKLWEYGLRTESATVFIDISHPPTLHRCPTILNGALHWMVDDDEYKSVFGVFPGCSNSIVVFNIESGILCTMSHPGDQCKEYVDYHENMGLMKIEGHLCYCGVLKEKIVVWALEDYEKRVWVMRCVVDTHPMQKECYSSFHLPVLPLNIFGNELLLRLNRADLFLYDLRLGTFRRVGYKWETTNHLLYAFAHVNTLVSLHGRVG